MRLFPIKSMEFDVALVISHAIRIRINAERNAKEATRPDAIFLKAPKLCLANAPQDMYMFPKQQLMVYMECRKGVLYNGAFVEVVSVSPIRVKTKSGSIVTLTSELLHLIVMRSGKGCPFIIASETLK